ncbi:unnamed protein product, partial [Brenthis ino]
MQTAASLSVPVLLHATHSSGAATNATQCGGSAEVESGGDNAFVYGRSPRSSYFNTYESVWWLLLRADAGQRSFQLKALRFYCCMSK